MPASFDGSCPACPSRRLSMRGWSRRSPAWTRPLRLTRYSSSRWRHALTAVEGGHYNPGHIFAHGRTRLVRSLSGGLVIRDDRTGSIILEQVTQRFALPREGGKFTAVQDVSFDI